MTNIPFLMNFKSESINLNINNKDMDFRNNMRYIFEGELEIDNNQDTILIFTRIHDDEVNFIGPYLSKNNLNYIRIDAEYFLKDFKISTSIKKDHLKTIITYKGEEIDLDNVKLVWNRHFDKEALLSEFDDPMVNQYILSEWWAILNFLYQIPHIKWINNPLASNNACKPQQLIAAHKAGFEVFDTLITNVPQDVIDFSYNKNVFFKATTRHFIEYPPGILNSLYGKRLERDNLSKLNTLYHCPVIFQEMGQDIEEIRVTVFNDCFFAAKYTNKNNDDWHNDDLAQIQLEEIVVPEIVRQKCKAVLKQLNLQYGAFDFLKKETNNWIFLEVNPIGDWRWVEVKTNFEITKAFTEFLKKKVTEECKEHNHEIYGSANNYK